MTGSTKATGSDRRSPQGCAHAQPEVAQLFPAFFSYCSTNTMDVSRVFSYCSSSTMDTEGHPKGVRNRKFATGSEGFPRSSTMGVLYDVLV